MGFLTREKRQACGCLPIGVVLTIAAAGSEMSDSSVITNENGWLKRGYNSSYCRPKFAVMKSGTDNDASEISDCKRMCGYHDAYDGEIVLIIVTIWN